MIWVANPRFVSGDFLISPPFGHDFFQDDLSNSKL